MPAWNDAQSATEMTMIGIAVFSSPTASPEMMFVAAPVREASAISRTGRLNAV